VDLYSLGNGLGNAVRSTDPSMTISPSPRKTKVQSAGQSSGRPRVNGYVPPLVLTAVIVAVVAVIVMARG
jgi:hypothetical protein